MADALITFMKQSSAFNFKKLAKKNSYSVKIVQTPKEISYGGCSYAVVVRRSDIGKLVNMCNQYGISYKRIFAVYTGTDGKKVYSEI